MLLPSEEREKTRRVERQSSWERKGERRAFFFFVPESLEGVSKLQLFLSVKNRLLRVFGGWEGRGTKRRTACLMRGLAFVLRQRGGGLGKSFLFLFSVQN